MNKRFAGLFFILGLVLAGCSEEPNGVGSKVLPKSDLLATDTISFTAIRSYAVPTIPGYSSFAPLLVGKVDDIESWGAIRFYGLPDTLSGTALVDVNLVLRARYHFGDSLAPFSVALHQILKNWGLDSLTIDTLQASGFYNLTPMTQPSFASVSDTDFVSMPLDTTVVRSWLNSIDDTVTTNYGILMRPTNSRVVKGFASFFATDAAHYPKLQIRYTRGGSRIDTVTVRTGYMRYGAKIANTSWSTDSTLMYVRSGVSYRSGVEFDISALPRRIAIHQARLELTRNSQLSKFNSYSLDSTYVYYVGSDGIITSTNDLSATTNVNGLRVYEFQVASFIQQWVQRQTNHKVIVGSGNEEGALDLYVLYGAAASANLKPRLRIIYSFVR